MRDATKVVCGFSLEHSKIKILINMSMEGGTKST
jgi:hypothetical protein